MNSFWNRSYFFSLDPFYSQLSSVQSLSHVWLCDPRDRSTPGFPVHHQLPELAQTHVHQVNGAIQPSHPLLSSSSPALSNRVFSSESVLHIRWPNGASASVSVLPLNIQDWFPLDWLVWSPCSPRNSQESSSTPPFKSIIPIVLLY